MSLLTRLETDLRDALARAFTESSVSLVDVGRALLAEDQAAGPTDGPRIFDVTLHPDDLEGLQTHAGALCRRLADLVSDQRAERSGSAGGPVDVRLEPDAGMTPGVFRVRSSRDGARPASADGGGASSGGATGSHVIASTSRSTATSGAAGTPSGSGASLPGRPRLIVVLGGTVVSGSDLAEGEQVELELDEHVALIGSAPDANLLLPADMVAPEHVEVRYREDGYHEAVALNDAPLRINGQPGARGLLTDGARLDLDDVSILYRRDFVGREASGQVREGFTRTDGA